MCVCMRARVPLGFRVLLVFSGGGGGTEGFPRWCSGNLACLPASVPGISVFFFPAGLQGIWGIFLLVFGGFGVFSCWSSGNLVGNLGCFPVGVRVVVW